MMRIVLTSVNVLPGGTWADGEYQVNLDPTSVTGDPGKKWCIAVESLDLGADILFPVVVTVPSFQLSNTYANYTGFIKSALHVASDSAFHRDVSTVSICSEMSMPMASWPGRIRVRMLDASGELAIANGADTSWIMVLTIFQRD